MAALPSLSSLSLTSTVQSPHPRGLFSLQVSRQSPPASSPPPALECLSWRFGPKLEYFSSPAAAKAPATSSRASARCFVAATDVSTVAETKFAFLEKFRKPIPSIYNNVIQELLVQQHLMRYNRTYQYDAVFALGFVTVFDQLMDGYPNDQDREAIFKAYIEALKEDPEQYRSDAKSLEEWATAQNAQSIVSFQSADGEVESALKDISERAGGKGNFHYSRFFAIGLFRLLEKANATDPATLEKLSKALNVSKLSVDRDLDVYRNLLSKLVQAKELLKEYVEREKRKQAEREASLKPSEVAAKIEAKNN